MLSVITALLPMLNGLLDKAIPDAAARDAAKAELARQILNNQTAMLNATKDVLKAEITGESWLQRNWRPMMMIWFAALVGAYWFGYTPDNLSEGRTEDLFDLVKIGIGGYIVGRSAEKTARVWKHPHGDI